MNNFPMKFSGLYTSPSTVSFLCRIAHSDVSEIPTVNRGDVRPAQENLFIRMLQLLLFLLGLNFRPMMGHPQSMVASSPPPLKQTFASDVYDIARSTEVSSRSKAGVLCSLAAIVSTTAMRNLYWVKDANAHG